MRVGPERLVVWGFETHEIALFRAGVEKEVVVEGVDTENNGNEFHRPVVENNTETADAVAQKQPGGVVVQHFLLAPPFAALPAFRGHAQKVQRAESAADFDLTGPDRLDFAALSAHFERDAGDGERRVGAVGFQTLEHNLLLSDLLLICTCGDCNIKRGGGQFKFALRGSFAETGNERKHTLTK